MSRTAKPPVTDTPHWPRELDAEQTRRLFEAAGDVALLLDGNGLVLDAVSHDLELQKAMRREWRGRAWTDTVTIDSRDKVQALIDAALADTATAPPRQVNHPARTGPDLPMQYAATRVSGNERSRASARLVAVGRDLRDSVALQRRLLDAQQSMERDYWRFREAETRYRNLFQSSSEAVLIVDGATLRVVEANPAAMALLSGGAAKPAKAVGVALGALFAPEAAEPLAAALAAARSVGKHERLSALLLGAQRSVGVAVSSFRQDQASFLLVRLAPLAPLAAGEGKRPSARAAAAAARAGGDPDDWAAAFLRGSTDALAFTDPAGRVVGVNRAFARMAQLSSEDQARGESLDRWLGRTGIELSMLLANLREGGSAGLFSTELRGALGLVTEVEIAASTLEPSGAATFAFAVRDVGRRLAPSEGALPTKVPASVQQLTELVGRVPLKQIVAETSDLIERLSIETALTMTKDNRAMAAQLLGLSRQSLYVKLRRFGMGGLEAGEDS